MAITYPTTIDTFTDVTCSDTRTPKDVMNDALDAIEALETKVGITSSIVTTSHDYKLSEIISTDKAVGKAATQTLTNKTLTSPIINTPTINTPTINTPTITVLDNALTIQDNVDPTKQLQFQASGITTGTTRTLTVPNENTTIVGTDTTQTLTNKTISTGSILSGLADESFSEWGIARQAIINGNFNIWEENTTFTPADDRYICDMWNALVETNASWTFARNTEVPTTKSTYSIKCTNATANNQCAIVNFIEFADAESLIGRTVSLSFQAKTAGTEIANIRATVLAWTGTADAITSDVITTWASDGTNPTWATSWTAENTAVNLVLTSTFQTFKIENIALDTAGTNNIAVVIWVDDGTIAVNDDFWISQVQLNVGSTALPFQGQHYALELAACMRYQIVITGIAVNGPIGYGSAATTQIAVLSLPFPAKMRAIPTTTFSNVAHFQLSDLATIHTGVSTLATGSAGGNDGDMSIILIVTMTSAILTTFRPYFGQFNSTSGKIICKAQL